MQERVRANDPVGLPPLGNIYSSDYFLLCIVLPVEEKRQQLERELSALRSDLAAHDDERTLREQESEACITISANIVTQA